MTPGAESMSSDNKVKLFMRKAIAIDKRYGKSKSKTSSPKRKHC